MVDAVNCVHRMALLSGVHDPSILVMSAIHAIQAIIAFSCGSSEGGNSKTSASCLMFILW